MADPTVVLGPFRLNPIRRELSREGKRVTLGARALDVLCALAAMDGEPISKDALLECVWPGAAVGENNLHVHISALRRLFGQTHKAQLVTIPGYGYRLSVSREQADARLGKPALAVLPFENLSGSAQRDSIALGLTDTILTQLARTRSLCLVSASRRQGGTGDGSNLSYRQSGIRYLLEGSMRCDDVKLRVNARLIDAETGAHLWAESYVRDFDLPYDAQDDLANRLAARVDVVVTDLNQREVLRKSTDNLCAWEKFERGLWHFAQCGIEENERARAFLRQSVDLDPNLSKAYQWLVYVHVQDGIHYRTQPITKSCAATHELAMKAIELDPHDAGSYAAAGFAAQISNELPTALANAEHALSLNPNDGDALRLKGACQLGLGMGIEGTDTLRMSVRLRPGDPLNWRAPHHLCWYSYLVGDWNTAVEAGKAALRANARQCLTHAWLAAALGQLGRVAEARSIMAIATKVIAPLSFSEHVERPLPWVSADGHASLLDGLGKAGWRR